MLVKINTFEEVDYWKAIILYGLNQATYKIALGKTLLQLAEYGNEKVEWHELSKVFLDIYVERLAANPRPQQSNPSRRTVMERVVNQLMNGAIDYEQAVHLVASDAFNDVIPRFQTIGRNTALVSKMFYHYDSGKKLYLHDTVFKLNEESRTELDSELEARWSLLEGAFTIGQEQWELANDIRDIYLKKGYQRTNLTKNIPFLSGYQGNVCFYCGEKLVENEIHVDHVIPRQLVMHDEIWNLVICHSLCNLHKEDALVGIHYMEKLIARNENIMGSNHPWRLKISSALGISKDQRMKMTLHHYENAKIALFSNYWENSPNYNRATDPFYKKLITILNNT